MQLHRNRKKGDTFRKTKIVKELEIMIESDTIKLLRECDAGIKMGIASIDEVLDHVQNEVFRKYLTDCKKEHACLEQEIKLLLNEYHDKGKNPCMMTEKMSQARINMKLLMNESDQTISGLMTDGCNMGVKSLSRYLNQYKAADEKSKNIAKRLIRLEEKLAVSIREFL